MLTGIGIIACLIDMETAFDTVWIQGLIYKLNDYKFPLNQIILIYNMISNKSFKVFHKNSYSNRYHQEQITIGNCKFNTFVQSISIKFNT